MEDTRHDCTATTSQWLEREELGVMGERELLKPTRAKVGSVWGPTECLGLARGSSSSSDRRAVKPLI